MKKLVIDFANEESVKAFLIKRYGDSYKLIVDFASEHGDRSLDDILDELGISTDTFDKSVDGVYVTVRHALRAVDQLESIKKYGLVDLPSVLSLDTPLHRFLKKRGIVVDIDKQLFTYLDITIPYTHFSCSACPFECEFSSQLSFLCELLKGISILESKLVHDQGEIEGFLIGDYEEIRDYSVIAQGPEVLHTIGKIYYEIIKRINPNVDYERISDEDTDEELHRFECDEFSMRIASCDTLSEFTLLNLWSESATSRFYILEFDIPLRHILVNHKSNEGLTDVNFNYYLLDQSLWSDDYVQLEPKTTIPYHCIRIVYTE